MKKKYAIYGYVEYAKKMRTKSGIIEARFTGGNINRNAPLPATCTTENVDVQNFIEGLPEYKDGVVTLVYKEESVISEEAQKVEGVESLQSARAYLVKQGVTLDRLQTKKDILSVAKELGIEFPSIK